MWNDRIPIIVMPKIASENAKSLMIITEIQVFAESFLGRLNEMIIRIEPNAQSLLEIVVILHAKHTLSDGMI